MTITDTSVLNYAYATAAFSGVALLFFLATSFYYAVTGRSRISAVGRYSVIIFGLVHLACLFDMGPNTFFYIRPSDSVKVFWARNILSILIFPCALLCIFEFLHAPDKTEGDKSPAKRHNIEHVHCLAKWSVFTLAVIAEIFVLPATIVDSSPVRWAAYSIGLILCILSAVLLVVYYSYYGIRLWNKKKTVLKYSFFNKKSRMTSAFIAWILVLVYLVMKCITMLCGHALLALCTYDVEVAVYMSGHLLLIIACWCACYATRNVHMHPSVFVESQTYFVYAK